MSTAVCILPLLLLLIVNDVGAISQYELLMDLYVSTNGPNWRNRTNWNVTNNTCTWYGVGCSSGTVVLISLSNNTLAGTLPPSWGNMTSLQTLYLQNNQLTGSLPSSWKKMTSLGYLDLFGNQLTGSLPSEWGNMTSLQNLYLANNQLIGSLPSSWGNMSLRILYLYINNLTGSLPTSWGNMASLQTLYLESNQLSGSLPPSWASMNNLQILRIGNLLSGSLPSSWGNMTNLTYLDLTSNMLTGSLPPSWGNLVRLQKLFLGINQFTGSLPPSWSMMRSLQTLYIYVNRLTGSLPSTWGNMTSVTSLDLSGNYLRHAVPFGWWRSWIAALHSNCLDPPASNQRPTWQCRFSSTSSLSQGFTGSLSEVDVSETRNIHASVSATHRGGNFTVSFSESLTLEPPYSSITMSQLSTANMVVITAVTSALVGGGGTTGLSSLQGAVGAMRLAYRCSSANGNDNGTTSPDPSAESSDNPLGIVLRSLPLELAAVGGSIIGNSVLVVIIAVASHALMKLRRMSWNVPSCLAVPSRIFSRAFFAVVSTSLLPGSVVIGYTVLMQPTMRAAVVSVASTARTAGSVALGVAGLVGCVVPGLLLWWKIRRFNLSVESVPQGRPVPFVTPAQALRFLAAPRWRWRSGSTDTLPQYGIVIEAHNRRWCFLVELCLAAAGGVVLGVSWVADDACSAAVWGTSLMMVLAIVEVVLWPHVVRCDAGVNILVCLLGVVVNALVLRDLEAEAAAVAIGSSALTYVPMLMSVIWIVHPVLRAAIALQEKVLQRPVTTCITNRQRTSLRVLVQLVCQGGGHRIVLDGDDRQLTN